MITTTSCGVLIFEPEGELLLCHMTGTAYWDIPKGLREADESELDAAVREAAEECGLRLLPAALIDLGRFAYRPAKDLHLYAVLHARVELTLLRCSSTFQDRWGRTRPEVDAFRWAQPDELARWCASSLAAVLTRKLSLEEVWARLF
ncbi:NUDIX hydrolase [Caldimonas brevitalea]|uniref:NUDIX hydrolase, phage-associated n=1 Tax=Caldimonas brevitalea TaxID=413882 RepID=A0A0G3BL52_9BURK|nr:NUDIX hydrolase [Caldimonas brevitalea]AKJ30184.1 NUDIX hydrolase, phage-associated [Caldimonas brevitalea]